MRVISPLHISKKVLALSFIGLSLLSPVNVLAAPQPVSAPVTIPITVPVIIPVPSLKAPEMVYPKNGQTLDLEGAYMFKVQPVASASGYLVGLFQDNVMVYENYRDSKQLSTNGEFVLSQSNPAHAKFHAGNMKVMIRAQVSGKWSDAREVTVNLKQTVVVPQISTTWPAPLKEGRFFVLAGNNFGNSGRVKLYKSGTAYNATVYSWSNNLIFAAIPANFSTNRNYTIGIQVNTPGNKQSPIVYRSVSK